MAKNNRKQENSFAVNLAEGQKWVLRDEEHKSKAFVPLQIDAGNSVEVVRVDGGLIAKQPTGEEICDNLVYTVKDARMGVNITWIIELKGTKNEAEAKHSITQIVKSIGFLQDQTAYPHASKYIKNRDYVFAAIAGAPDKTLPPLNNQEIKALCRKLKELSHKRKNVKDMFMLFCYIRPNKQCKKAQLKGITPPYDILCYDHNDSYIAYPSMLMKLLEKKEK